MWEQTKLLYGKALFLQLCNQTLLCFYHKNVLNRECNQNTWFGQVLVRKTDRILFMKYKLKYKMVLLFDGIKIIPPKGPFNSMAGIKKKRKKKVKHSSLREIRDNPDSGTVPIPRLFLIFDNRGGLEFKAPCVVCLAY